MSWKPKFSMDFNLGHLLVFCGMCGSMLLVFRSAEMKAVETAVKVEEHNERLRALEQNQQEVVRQLTKVATILDTHLEKKP